MSKREYTVALAGNPNCGKTTIFNAITGSRQHVGNYPGVTVEKKEGQATRRGTTLNIVDLPGTYSLTPYSIDETVARTFLIDQRPDVVIDIIDCSNLERNLYLATQLMELGVPLVLAFNMSDVAVIRGFQIDTEQLSELLGVPVVSTVGHRGKGIDELLDKAIEVAENGEAAIAAHRRVNYGHEIEPHVEQFAEQIATRYDGLAKRARWFALKLLENDKETLARIHKVAGAEELTDRALHLRNHIESICGDSAEIILADRRYGFISGACAETVSQIQQRRNWSEIIDAVLTNRFFGLPIFAVMMFMTFQLVFTLGNPIVDMLGNGLGIFGDHVGGLLAGQGLLQSLVVDGLIGGVGAVLVFVPLIVLMYLAVAFLEDTGYMARAAFVIDSMMHRIGLHGRSFVPMLIGFGCSVPGILATRTLETRRDRMTTMMVLPLMSCSARLPIYILILGAFFPQKDISLFGLVSMSNRGLILFGIYAVGIVLAIVMAKLFRATIFRGESAAFVMELPPYRMPTTKGIVLHMWERTWEYVKKAGTIILAAVIIMWALSTWPGPSEAEQAHFDAQRAEIEAANLPAPQQAEKLTAIDRAEHEAKLRNSAIGRVGKSIAPVMEPLGFDWRISTALIPAFAAKEAFVSQMGVIFSLGEGADEKTESLQKHLAANYTPLQGLCVMLFCLITAPCVATIVVTSRESGSWKWGLFQLTYLAVLAYVITLIVYQVGRLIV